MKLKGEKAILASVIKKLPKGKNVLGVLLFGSAAKNKMDQYSDIDVYVLLKKKVNYSRFNFLIGNRRVDVIFDTVGGTRHYLKKERYNVKRNTSDMLAHGKIIQKTNQDLERIISEAKRNLKLRTKYSNDEVLMHKYSIDDFWGEVQRDIKNNDYLAFGLDCQLLLNNIIELLLKLHGEYFRQPNEMLDALNKIDKKFTRKVDQFYQTNNIKTKRNILSWLISYIYDESNGPLPKRWTIR